jgi:uncharacterized protein (TIGR02246 family)
VTFSPARIFLVIIVGLMLFAVGRGMQPAQTPLGTSADRSSILQFRAAHNVAWNNHNAKALADLYAPDGDRISASGVHYVGRKQIEQSYVKAFAGVYKTSSVKDESTTLRFLTADVALVDVDDMLTTVKPGETVHHHVASIYVKQNGQWTMVAERATTKQ